MLIILNLSFYYPMIKYGLKKWDTYGTLANSNSLTGI